jgi:hypothetical protein
MSVFNVNFISEILGSNPKISNMTSTRSTTARVTVFDRTHRSKTLNICLKAAQYTGLKSGSIYKKIVSYRTTQIFTDSTGFV